ncbi:hypothetical protein Bca4012_058232 [Brassica carinata]
MAKAKKISTDHRLGCESLLGCIFQSWSPRRRKPSLPEKDHKAKDYLPPKSTAITNPKTTIPRKSTDSSTQTKKPDPLKTKPDESNARKSSESARKSMSSASPRTESKRFSPNGVMGNIIVKPQPAVKSPDVSQTRSRWEGKTVNYRHDPETLKRMGNEEYCRGRFGEALVFYERAILADPKTPTYWSNKSAALISLGRLLEASDACEEALRLNPNYERAHQRLASLQLRFEDAVAASRQASRLDPSNEEVNTVARKARAVAAARLTGNLLFNASKFEAACVVYTEGLEQDPYNALLLCNRAASRFKLGLFEKAIEDSTLALNLQPMYRKARRRRADSYAKLEKWQHAIQDYELLMMETPEDEETRRVLADANVRLRKQTNEDVRFKGVGSDLVVVN